MGFLEFIVVLVAINAVSKLLRERGKRVRSKDMDRLVEEVRALREEVQQLRRQNNDVILSLDSTVDRLERRVSYVESQGPLGAGVERGSQVAVR